MPGPGRKWQKGVSGNPVGRKPGTGVVERQRAALAEHLPAVLDKLVKQALDGDTQAMRLLLERVLPPYRSIDRPLELGPLPPAAGPKLRAVLEQVTTGALGLNEAERLIGLLSEATALASRVRLHDPVAQVETSSRAAPDAPGPGGAPAGARTTDPTLEQQRPGPSAVLLRLTLEVLGLLGQGGDRSEAHGRGV